MFGNSFFKARLTEFKNCFLNDYSKDIWLMANVGPGGVWPTGTIPRGPQEFVACGR